MAKKSTINQYKYDSTHCKNYHIKLNTTIDSDIIQKLSSVPSMQGYIKQLIRNDLVTNSVPVSLSDATIETLTEESSRIGIPVPELISTIVNESVVRILLNK